MNWFVLTEDYDLKYIGHTDLYQEAYQQALDKGIPFIDVVSEHQLERWVDEYSRVL
jgi:hypothetical protein